uniref:Single-stranded-DNA-specific exonuclease RecJ n=1 Tax=uncultured marine group II/III euryarchaeote KM3_181_H05 TaxID=1457945 RepID=A0A075GSW8_9EURY|nr:single-stranded-DNA-specific exonuclease RecJ [uncultured marine group II/III euryarchaeote KM3_181_H05]
MTPSGGTVPPLVKAAQPLAARLREIEQPVRVIGHYDCDGLTSSAILVQALLRLGKRFHLTNVLSLAPGVIEQLNREVPELVLFTDLGSGYMDLLAGLETEALVVDHHLPQGEVPGSVLELNAHKAGVDGNREASAASAAFALALALDEANRDLAPIALAGACGDRQMAGGWQGWNLEIANMANEDNYLKEKQQLPLHGATLAEALAGSLEPYLVGVSGQPAAAESALREIGLDPAAPPDGLTAEEAARLADWLALKLLEQGAGSEQREQLFAPSYQFPGWGCTVSELASLVDACGRQDDTATGIALLLGSTAARGRAGTHELAQREQLLALLGAAKFERRNAIQHFSTSEPALKGTICGLALGYFLDRSLPAIGLSPRDGELIVSSRATPELIARGLNLAEVMSQSAGKCGGIGGGHAIAAGATVPLDAEEQFLAAADEQVVAQLGL